MEYTFRRLEIYEASKMFDLIVQRIRWMDEQDIHQWNETEYDQAYPLAHYEKACRAGNAYGLFADDVLVCAALLLEEDAFWPEDNINALYVHAFASRCDVPGAGAAFLRKTEDYARAKGKDYLRLDSQRDNEKLARYYRAQGFADVGECEDGPYLGTLRQKKL